MLAQKQVHLMGTVIDILVEADSHPDLLAEEACRLLDIYNKRFSANDTDSELMAINHAAGKRPVEVDKDLFELIKIGKRHSLADTSNLNIAIGPLVQTWRIGFSDAKLPDPAAIKEKQGLIQPEKIVLEDGQQTVFLAQEGMKIDLGALAKGFIADKIMSYLKEHGARSALINLGGNVLVYGPNQKRPDKLWYIGIQNPQKARNQNLGLVKIADQSVVTSGIYERHIVVDGTDYHHIFDSNTGYPIETEMASLTIVSDLSLDGEIWTSRLFGLPLSDAVAVIDQLPHIEGIIVTKDNRFFVSKGLKTRFIPLF